MASGKRRTYTSEQRQAVLATVRSKGVNVAAKEHGVAQSCVSRWAASAGVKRGDEAAAASEAPTEKARRTSKPRVAKSYTPSQKAQVLEHASEHGVTAASAKFGISRFSIYDWQRKLAKAARGEGPSPTSGPAPKDIEEQRDREVLAECANTPGWGRVRSAISYGVRA